MRSTHSSTLTGNTTALNIIIKTVNAIQDIKPAKKESMVFEFSSFDTLSELLKHISAHNLLNMRLYSLKGNFYMAVPKRRVPALMYEYSLKSNKSSVAEIKLSEHGRFIAGGYRLMHMGAMLKKIN